MLPNQFHLAHAQQVKMLKMLRFTAKRRFTHKMLRFTAKREFTQNSDTEVCSKARVTHKSAQ